MAHQMNLVFGDIFKESEVFRRVSKEAVQIVSYFHSSTFLQETCEMSRNKFTTKQFN